VCSLYILIRYFVDVYQVVSFHQYTAVFIISLRLCLGYCTEFLPVPKLHLKCIGFL
jgi:hypothetical protein